LVSRSDRADRIRTGRSGLVRVDLAHDLEPVERRQHEVEDDEVERMGDGECQPLRAVVRHAHAHPLRPERPREEV